LNEKGVAMADFYYPYLVNYTQPVAEDIVIFCVSMLTAIMVSAEGQAFVATLLGDSRENPKDRLHFNVFMHMSVLGTINFFVAGFGWAKEIDIDTAKFKNHPKLFLIISRMSGPLANLLMANIAASINWILGRYGVEDKVFSTIVVVNVTMALYSLLIIPPLPGSSFIVAFLPRKDIFRKLKKYLCLIGPFVVVGTFLIIRLSGWTGISSLFTPAVAALTGAILDI
jgi:Zn-dependent protease